MDKCKDKLDLEKLSRNIQLIEYLICEVKERYILILFSF